MVSLAAIAEFVLQPRQPSRAHFGILIGLAAFSAGCGAMVPACGKNVVMRSCDDSRPVETLRVDDGSWDVLPVGADRVYFRRDGHPPRPEDFDWLKQARRSLHDLSGREPAPVGLLLRESSDPRNLEVARDPERRIVWPVLPGESRGAFTIVHEWTHGVLAALRTNDRRNERFVEDGLCDLVATVVVGGVMGGPSREVDGAAKSLRERLPSLPARVNLLVLAPRYDETRRSWKQFCSDPPDTGYDLGLALWLAGNEPPADAVVRAFAAIRANPSRSLEDIAEAEPGQQLHARDLDVRRALAVLERAEDHDAGHP
jgi:hypothetical protein